MLPIKSYYLNKQQRIDPSTLKSGCLKKQFNISSNAIVSMVNTFKLESVMFIFESKCTKPELLFLSQIFLQTIKTLYPELLSVNNQQIFLGEHPISSSYFRHTNRTAIFSHSIVLRTQNNQYYVSHLDLTPNNFAIEVSNAFVGQYNDIVNHFLNK